MTKRIGAYILAGDPVWLVSSLARYYDVLDDLVVVAPESRLGWTGRPIPVDECLNAIENVDSRGIARVVWGEWQDASNPMNADTAQRQAGIDALEGSVDWILQIDNDEVLPDVSALLKAIDVAEQSDLASVEWPMRILFRRLRQGGFLEVCAEDGGARYDYPGPVAVRAGSRTVDARRCTGAFLRPVVEGDDRSLQVQRFAEPDEVRIEMLKPHEAIVHNSWGRTSSEIRRKIRTWGHAAGLKSEFFYWTRWWPAPFLWRAIHDFHPFAGGLWPRLRPATDVSVLLSPPDL